MKNDLDTMTDMLDYAEIPYELDEETYAPQIKVIRITKFDPTTGKNKVVAIFDFNFVGGGLRNIS